MVNVEDDQPELIFGPTLEGQSQHSDVAPFYISLRVHDYVLRNAMLDSGASHNLMPKAIMEKLGLDITRKYHDLCSSNSSRERCIGLIKDLVVSLDQILAKNVLMDVVVVDIPPRFGMLLSKSWGEKIKGTMQLDFSYATIPMFGQMKKLYQEQKNQGKFKDTSIDVEYDDGEVDIEVNQMEDLQLKDNVIPKGLIPLEELFDQDDVAQKPSLLPTEKGVEDVNIGSIENPKMVKLSKALPSQVKEKYISLLSSFNDVFVWNYSDLKAYDTSIIYHIIPIKPNQKPFRQKLRRINPKLQPSIEKEVNRLYKVGIVIPIRFSNWISNLVSVCKIIGEIWLCIDFRNLNKVSLKDNYPLPKMDHILQRVVGASRMSLLDGYSGYNQILVHEDDRDKTVFTTLWGTFHYAKMPFRLKNVGATFQQAMKFSFYNEIDVFIVVYLDDLIVFSNSDEEHHYHLKIVF
eukprot:PITA_21279